MGKSLHIFWDLILINNFVVVEELNLKLLKY